MVKEGRGRRFAPVSEATDNPPACPYQYILPDMDGAGPCRICSLSKFSLLLGATETPSSNTGQPLSRTAAARADALTPTALAQLPPMSAPMAKFAAADELRGWIDASPLAIS